MISMKLRYLFALSLLLHLVCSGQNAIDSLLSDFNFWKQIPEENIHLHLNKSIYVKGEDIGYTAYVIDQRTKKPSLATTNLYVQLLDDNLDVVNEKLLLVKNGVTTHVFETNSTTPAGDYSIKAFTNWMRNFEKPLFAQEPLRVLDPAVNMSELYEVDERSFTLSILPEGGHAVDGVFVKMGAILKDQYGNGIAASGKVIKNREEISVFQLDDNGIGSFLFLPDARAEYKFLVELPEKQVVKNGLEIDEIGVSIDIAESQSKLYINLRTNAKTLDDRRGEELIVAINDHQNITAFQVSLKDRENLLAIERDSLSVGMNQISYFTKNGTHLGDRLYFKSDGLEISQKPKVTILRQLDSLNLNLEFKGISKASSSVSVLPEQSKARPQNHIISKYYLSPYLKEKIQNPNQYFEKNDRSTDIALDNLLLTQGWSIHDWKDEFDDSKTFHHRWENGITYFGNSRFKNHQNIFLLPGSETPTRIIEISKNQREFIIPGLFPYEEEKLKLSASDNQGKFNKIKLYSRFLPNKIPFIDSKKKLTKNFISAEFDTSDLIIQNFSDAETLTEIVVESDELTPEQKLIWSRSKGRVDFFDDYKRKKYINIEQYLRQNGFNVRFSGPNEFLKSNMSRSSGKNESLSIGTSDSGSKNSSEALIIRAQSSRVGGPPVIVVNGQPFFSSDVLIGLDMSLIDYIEIDNSGLSRWASGLNPFGSSQDTFGSKPPPVIIINYDPLLSPYNKNEKSYQEVEVPLTFSKPLDFYRPLYNDYNIKQFKKLGVIDWQGKLQIENGKAEFTMPYVGQDTMWFIIEGMAEDGTLIHSVQQASISK